MQAGTLHRNRLATFERPHGVFRIVCIGDSMVFGQGVAEWQAMPAQLQRLLNRSNLAVPFECLNEGVCGYSLHNAWDRYRIFGYRFDPNLVIIVLSHNDIELYQCQTGSYHDHVMRTWRDGSPERETFVARASQIVEDARERFLGTRFAIAFYDLPPSQFGDDLDRIRKVIAGSFPSLPFIDLSLAFDAATSDSESLHASPADMVHPSVSAHGRAARYLARSMMRHGLLQSEPVDRQSVCIDYFDFLLRSERASIESALHCSEIAGMESESITEGEWTKRIRHARAHRAASDLMDTLEANSQDAVGEIDGLLREGIILKGRLFHLREHFKSGIPFRVGFQPSVIQGCEIEGATLLSSRMAIEQVRQAIEHWWSQQVRAAYPPRFQNSVESLLAALGIAVELAGLCSELEPELAIAETGCACSDFFRIVAAVKSWRVWLCAWPLTRLILNNRLELDYRRSGPNRSELIVIAQWDEAVPALLCVRWRGLASRDVRLIDTRSLLCGHEFRAYAFTMELSFAGRLDLEVIFPAGSSTSGNARCAVQEVLLVNGCSARSIAKDIDLLAENPVSLSISLRTELGDLAEKSVIREMADRLFRTCGSRRNAVVFGANQFGLNLANAMVERGVNVHLVDSYRSGEIAETFAIEDPTSIGKDLSVGLASPRYWAEMEMQLRAARHVGPIVRYPLDHYDVGGMGYAD